MPQSKKPADPAEIRERLESAKRELARGEGELEGFRRESEQAKSRLQEILGCAPGEERKALAELQASIEADEREVVSLLDQAEQANEERSSGESLSP